ncbi:hypothetical protein LTR74_003043 [Friedmanniomyces endolithicus]|nr:hypothetical protein LTR74_003043 [Friedmanniomyces endolithicus]
MSSHLQTPAATTTTPAPQRSARHAAREARAQFTEAYKRIVEPLSEEQVEALGQRERLAELRRQAYRKLRGVEEIPYMAEEERLIVLLQMIQAEV